MLFARVTGEELQVDGGVDADAYIKLFNRLWVAPEIDSEIAQSAVGQRRPNR